MKKQTELSYVINVYRTSLASRLHRYVFIFVKVNAHTNFTKQLAANDIRIKNK